jgi:polyphosphate glucokinase
MGTVTSGARTLAIDIGGSNIKSVVLDAKGKPATEILRDPTPRPATPAAILRLIEKQARRHGRFDRISAGFPGVIRRGVVWTAVNIHPRWVGFDFAAALRKRLKKPARVANDADIQGMGAIRGKGVEMMVTLGTGVGCSLFVDGVLVPNIELGHHPFQEGRTYEELLGRAALDEAGKRRWNKRLQAAIAQWAALFNYDWLYLGGGNTKKITFELPENVRITPNREGLLGGIHLWRDR